MPYVHVVVLKLKPDTSAAQTSAIAAGVLGLKAHIPEIATVRAGVDLNLDPSGCQLALVATFASAEAYAVYATHPAHVALVTEHIKPVLEKRAAVQFTAGADPSQAPGVTHCVLLKLKDDATAAQKEAIIAALSALPGDIPQIKAYRVGAVESQAICLLPVILGSFLTQIACVCRTRAPTRPSLTSRSSEISARRRSTPYMPSMRSM